MSLAVTGSPREERVLLAFFGTRYILFLQSAIVAGWIDLKLVSYATFDHYPFVLLNLPFSLQAAKSALLKLLAQTRQADRDKAL
jgi:uncharacterized membrane protein